jgi:hypothetical protein
MNVNGKMIPVETIPGSQTQRELKKNGGGGEIKCYI